MAPFNVDLGMWVLTFFTGMSQTYSYSVSNVLKYIAGATMRDCKRHVGTFRGNVDKGDHGVHALSVSDRLVNF